MKSIDKGIFSGLKVALKKLESDYEEKKIINLIIKLHPKNSLEQTYEILALINQDFPTLLPFIAALPISGTSFIHDYLSKIIEVWPKSSSESKIGSKSFNFFFKLLDRLLADNHQLIDEETTQLILADIFKKIVKHALFNCSILLDILKKLTSYPYGDRTNEIFSFTDVLADRKCVGYTPHPLVRLKPISWPQKFELLERALQLYQQDRSKEKKPAEYINLLQHTIEQTFNNPNLFPLQKAIKMLFYCYFMLDDQNSLILPARIVADQPYEEGITMQDCIAPLPHAEKESYLKLFEKFLQADVFCDSHLDAIFDSPEYFSPLLDNSGADTEINYITLLTTFAISEKLPSLLNAIAHSPWRKHIQAELISCSDVSLKISFQPEEVKQIADHEVILTCHRLTMKSKYGDYYPRGGISQLLQEHELKVYTGLDSRSSTAPCDTISALVFNFRDNFYPVKKRKEVITALDSFASYLKGKKPLPNPIELPIGFLIHGNIILQPDLEARHKDLLIKSREKNKLIHDIAQNSILLTAALLKINPRYLHLEDRAGNTPFILVQQLACKLLMQWFIKAASGEKHIHSTENKGLINLLSQPLIQLIDLSRSQGFPPLECIKTILDYYGVALSIDDQTYQYMRSYKLANFKIASNNIFSENYSHTKSKSTLGPSDFKVTLSS